MFTMGKKLLWTGLVFILALTPALAAIGLSVNGVVILVGAILMVIGLILYWMNK